jgi:hypothetical protein
MRKTAADSQLEETRLKIELADRGNLLHARDDALSHARMWFRDRSEEATPEQIMSVAAKFEAYLTAPAMVLTDKEATV